MIADKLVETLDLAKKNNKNTQDQLDEALIVEKSIVKEEEPALEEMIGQIVNTKGKEIVKTIGLELDEFKQNNSFYLDKLKKNNENKLENYTENIKEHIGELHKF